MFAFLSHLNTVNTVILLRSFAIALQAGLIGFVIFWLNYQLPWQALAVVVLLEVVFNFASYWYFRSGKDASKSALFIQICADIFFLSLLLYFSGGATNAFVSLLLIPIAIAAVTLTTSWLAVASLVAVASYSFLLWRLPMHVMHGNMQGHFIAMWINFLFSALVVALVVSRMARRINQKELAIAHYREEQLKQEQVLSLGVASAQVTHQLATPLATIQLLAEELAEEQPDNPIVSDINKELARCTKSLGDFRKMVFDIKEKKNFVIKISDFVEQIKDHVVLHYPDIDFDFYQQPQDDIYSVTADSALLPAVLNLINNGVRASRQNHHSQLLISSELNNNVWQFSIRDFGKGFSLKKLKQLGLQAVDSEQGLGMAVLLSNASLEKLGGRLSLTNHESGGAVVTLFLPAHSEK